jgi:hypothetical protein
MDGPATPIPSTTVADVIVPKGTFGPTMTKKRRRKSAYGQQISDEDVAGALSQGHPKSRPVPHKR